MNIAVITGASSGLGKEYVRQVVEQLPSVDEIWLIARRKERLEAIAAAYSDKTFRLLSLDLCLTEDREVLRQTLADIKPTVTLLINNAGYGKLGNFSEMPTADQVGMVDLNCGALTAVTSLVLPYMVRGSGILNVSSIASYVPTPRMTVYCSTKAYVSSFSQSLRAELRPRGIHVLAVCPGPMATEFLDVAAITGHSKTFESLPYCRPETVARVSLSRLLRGKSWYTNRVFYKFYRVLAKLLPNRLLMKFSAV